ncbi:MAG: hypothetical protein WC217_02470 [Candidatus Paceibacterota bacterium]|jgi:hypothetical protein
MNAQRSAVRSIPAPNAQEIIGGLRANLTSAINAQARALRQQQNAEKAWQQKVAYSEFLASKRFKANLRAAVIGAQRIIAFAQTPDIQELIRVEGELRATYLTNTSPNFIPGSEGEITFFAGSYISPGDDGGRNDSHVAVALRPSSLWLVARDYHSHELLEIPFATPGRIETYLTTGDLPEFFGGPIISSETRRDRMGPLLLQGLGWRNNIRFESFSDVFGKVIIECADLEKFSAYCATALNYFSR